MKRFKPALVFAAVWLIACGWTANGPGATELTILGSRPAGRGGYSKPGTLAVCQRDPVRRGRNPHQRDAGEEQAAPPAEVVLPNGWKIAPAGKQVAVGRLPEEAVFYKGQIVVLNTGYYKKGGPKEPREPQEISIVDPASGKAVRVLPLAPCFLAPWPVRTETFISVEGTTRWSIVTTTSSNWCRNIRCRGMPRDWRPSIRTTWPWYTWWWWPAIRKSENRVLYGKGKLAILNTATGKIEPGEDAGYFPHTVRYFNHKLYVTVLGEDRLYVYDYQDSKAKFKTYLPVGKTPQDICPDPKANRLFVVNTGSDTLSVVKSVVDAGKEKDEVVKEIDVRNEIAFRSQGVRFGCGPTSCAVDGDRLYVTLAYRNAVGIFDLGEGERFGKSLGFIPTGWYPTKVIPGRSRWPF